MDPMMDAIRDRHSVRQYRPDPVEREKLDVLENAVSGCNRASGLNIRIITDEPRAFDGFMAHYGRFSDVRNYIAMVGRKGLDEEVGYYGEKLVLLIQSMGLNTCWVALSFSKRAVPCDIGPGEKLHRDFVTPI